MRSARVKSWVLLFGFWFATVVPVLSAEAGLGSMDGKLDALFRAYLDQSFGQQPLSATQLGDHRFDHRLEDLSAEGRRQWVRLDRVTLERLDSEIRPDALSRAGRIDHAIFRDHLTRSLWAAENLHPYEEDPRAYNQYVADSVFLLLTQSTLPRETNIANSLARMEAIPGILAAARANLSNPAPDLTDTAIRQNAGAISFYQTTLFELAGRTPQLPRLKASASNVVAALRDYDRYLRQDLLPRARGEWRLGAEKFGRKLEMVLDTGMNAAQVLADAEAEYARVQQEMYVVARQLWSAYYPTAPLPPDSIEGRRDTVRRVLDGVARDHSRPEHLVRDARATVAEIKRFIRDNHILKLPEPDTCRVIEMPEFQRGNSTAYMNSPPPLDPKAVGHYAVSPPPGDWDADRVQSFLQEYNRSMLQILTIHEAYPGHYVQFEYANRNPSLIRRVLPSGVYVEGWAVYTEQTLLDQGYGKRDLALRMSQLKFYLRAVVNAILDHKMHCTELTDAQAMDLLVGGAYQSEGEARLKVLRAKQSSTQLSTYFVGRMALYRLRQSVQQDLGDRFDLAAFHHAVLEEGAVPVKHLPELVRARLLPVSPDK